jgi:hypothetical protein
MVIIKSDINKLLIKLLGRVELVDAWWFTSSMVFNDRTPNEVYQSGEAGRQAIFNYVMSFCIGEYQ